VLGIYDRTTAIFQSYPYNASAVLPYNFFWSWLQDMFEEKRSILEPAGALALAGAEAYCKYYGLKGENVVAITSGANMNFDRLRLVTELADVGRKREAVLATFLPEEQGSFKKFAELVGRMNITEFKYRYDCNAKDALVLYSVGIYTDDELKAMVERMESSKLRTVDLTDNDLAKDHLRYFIGGRSEVTDELVYRFIFPERPGALMKFLDAFSPRWNISLFHYRAQVCDRFIIHQFPCCKVVLYENCNLMHLKSSFYCHLSCTIFPFHFHLTKMYI
jgi:threonine dehydratase